MATYVVLAKDLDQGDDFVNGPFASENEAGAWAAGQAEERAGDQRHLIDASEDGLLVQLQDGPNTHELAWEWIVMPLCAP